MMWEKKSAGGEIKASFLYHSLFYGNRKKVLGRQTAQISWMSSFQWVFREHVCQINSIKNCFHTKFLLFSFISFVCLFVFFIFVSFSENYKILNWTKLPIPRIHFEINKFSFNSILCTSVRLQCNQNETQIESKTLCRITLKYVFVNMNKYRMKKGT